MHHTENTATLVISRAVKPRRGDAFNRWIEELIAAAKEAPGYRGAARLGQTDALQHLLIRFADRSALERFRDDANYRRLDRAGRALAVGREVVEVGAEIATELPSDSSSATWKRFVLTWTAVLPIILVVSTAVRSAAPDLPPPLQIAGTSLVLTALLQWVILPRIQRLGRFWMMQGASGALRT